MSKEDDIIKELLTPSQMKILKDQEQWMKDSGVEYTKERGRIDAAHDVKKRFPTEKSAREALDIHGGDPIVSSIYERGLNNYRSSNKKNIKPVRKCKCK